MLTDKGKEAWNDIKSSFRFEECETEDIFNSQKINKIKIPEKYDDVIKALASDEKLEEINARFNINEIGYTQKKEST